MSENLFKLADRFERLMQQMLENSNNLIDRYIAILGRKSFDTNQLVNLVQVGGTGATGTIDVSHRVNEQFRIKTILYCVPTGAVPTFQIGSDTFTLAPNLPPILQDLQFIVGGGDTLKMTWASGTGTTGGFLAIFGENVGGKLG